MIQDKSSHPMSTFPKPVKGVPYTDPEFGSTVTRITDVSTDTGQVGVRAPMYSTVPAWNADETYLILYQTAGYSGSGLKSGWLLYDGKTYAFIRQLSISAADVEDVYWSASDPDVFFYVTDYGVPGGNYNPVLARYHVSTGTSEVVHSFLAGLPVANQKVDFGHILYMSWDNSLIGIREQAGDPNIYTESYNISTQTENGWTAYSTAQSYQGLQVAPSGQTAIIGSKVVNPITQVLMHNMSTDTEEHGALGPLANGDDAWISSQYGSSAFPSVPYGNIIVEDLQTGSVKTVVGVANGWLSYPAVTSHVSTFAFQAPGWVANSIVGNPAGQGLLDSEVLLANVDTGEVCRLAHHHSNGSAPPQAGVQGYWAEPHVVISPSGTRLLYGSDWGGTSSVDTYVIETPSYKP